ncbi:MAG: N-methylhydantoinase [Thermomicrobiales bacterium]|jgi:N-methylhydantoinase A|nr:N-methylhydantoinase [Thermomicrobiales bacterium]MEA2584459.1 N-methylhydantoinase [Thermomicrobiales bacterium]
MPVRIGIDTGGTFTDLIGVDEATNRLVIAKTPSTPRRPVEAVMNAIENSGVTNDAIAALSIGTTVATNALLTRRGANVIYVTTAGFEDIPHIQRMNRKLHFSLKWRKPKPLVERRNCLGVVERLDFHGRVLIPLEVATLEALATDIEARRTEYPEGSLAIAVCLLFSYVNPDHELRLRDFLRNRFPDIPVSLSHEVAPIWREYERGSTVIADSYVKPIMQEYVSTTRDALEAEHLQMPWSLMKSNGGKTTAESAEAEPIKLLLSGLAGGIIAGHYFGQLLGLDNLVTLDMGGTSCDVGLIRGGKIGYSTNFEIEFGLPVATPTIDLTTIGAGGGSIAWIDKGGLLRVGPQSAGADPGPVCYDAGGTEVTVTDANLVLGRLNPGYFLGGKIGLNVAKAEQALTQLGERLGLDKHAAAQAVVDIANENMANAIRVLSIDRGLDPREFALVAFGGAGPLSACDIATKMGMTKVVVPVYPGLTSAFGALIAEPKVNKVWSKHFRSDSTDAETVDRHLKDLVAGVITELRAEGFAGEPTVSRSVSMRYWGQNYEQDVPMPDGEVTPELLDRTLDEFHRVHEQFYGYSISGETIELIRFNVEATGHTSIPSLPSLPTNGHAPTPTPTTRPVFFQGHGVVDCPILQRDDLPAGFRLTGPAIVEEVVSTTLVHPGQRLDVHPTGVMTITL